MVIVILSSWQIKLTILTLDFWKNTVILLYILSQKKSWLFWLKYVLYGKSLTHWEKNGQHYFALSNLFALRYAAQKYTQVRQKQRTTDKSIFLCCLVFLTTTRHLLHPSHPVWKICQISFGLSTLKKVKNEWKQQGITYY